MLVLLLAGCASSTESSGASLVTLPSDVQVDGSQSDDLSVLDDSRTWGNYCDGEIVDVPLVEGFTRSAGCSENGQLTSNFQLLIGRTKEGALATLSCGVTAASNAPLDGREDAVESMCSTAYGQLFGFGAD